MAGIDFTSDLHDQVGAWMEAFISESSLDRYRRACAWTASEVAKAASRGATEAIDQGFDDPMWRSATSSMSTGDPGAGVPIVALAAVGVLRRSDLLDEDGETYRVCIPTVWPAGDLRRYALTLA